MAVSGTFSSGLVVSLSSFASASLSPPSAMTGFTEEKSRHRTLVHRAAKSVNEIECPLRRTIQELTQNALNHKSFAYFCTQQCRLVTLLILSTSNYYCIVSTCTEHICIYNCPALEHYCKHMMGSFLVRFCNVSCNWEQVLFKFVLQPVISPATFKGNVTPFIVFSVTLYSQHFVFFFFLVGGGLFCFCALTHLQISLHICFAFQTHLFFCHSFSS